MKSSTEEAQGAQQSCPSNAYSPQRRLCLQVSVWPTLTSNDFLLVLFLVLGIALRKKICSPMCARMLPTSYLQRCEGSSGKRAIDGVRLAKRHPDTRQTTTPRLSESHDLPRWHALVLITARLVGCMREQRSSL
jgi:hypothetical protein